MPCDWISVNDGLPEIGQKVLVCNPEHDSICFWIAVYERDGTWDAGAHRLNSNEVTKWIPVDQIMQLAESTFD